MAGDEFTAKFKLDVSDLKQGIKDADNSIKLANAQFKAASAGMDKWSKSSDGISAKLKQLGTVLDAEKTKLSSLRGQLEQNEQAHQTNQKRVAELKAKLQQLADQGVSKTSEEYKKYEAELRKALKDEQNSEKAVSNLNDQVKLQETVVQKTENEIGRWDKALEQVEAEERQADKATDQLDDSLEDAEKSLKDVDSASRKAEGGFTVLKGAMASLAADAVKALARGLVQVGKAAIGAVNDVASVGDEIDKTSQKVGMSTDAYQEWDYAMKLSGTSMKSSAAGFKTLTNNFDKAVNGSDSAAEKFKRLGLSVDELKGKSREEIFSATISALQGVSDETEKAALANQLLGKSGQNLMPLLNKTAEETQGMIDEAREYGLVMSEDAVKASAQFEDTLTLAKGAVTGLKNALIGELLPGISDIVKGFAGLVKGDSGAIGMVESGIEKLVGSFSDLAPRLVQIIEKIASALLKSAPKLISGLLDGILSALPTLIQTVGAIAPDLISSIASSLLNAAPTLLKTVLDLATQLINSLSTMAPQLITAIVGLIPSVVSAILRATPQLLNAAIQLGLALIQSLPKITQMLISMLPQLITEIVRFFVTSAPLLVEAFYQLFYSLILAIPEIQSQILAAMPAVWSAILKGCWELVKMIPRLFKSAWNGIKKAFASSAVGKYFKKIWKSITNVFKGVTVWFRTKFRAAWEGIKRIFVGVKKFFAKKWNDIKNVFKSVGTWFGKKFKDAWEKIKSAFSSIGEWFKGKWEAIKLAFKNAPQYFRQKFRDAVKKIKELFIGLVSFFGDIWTKIKNKFTALGTNIGSAISGAVTTGINAVISKVENAVNGGIRLINRAIDFVNKVAHSNFKHVDEVSLPRLGYTSTPSKKILKDGRMTMAKGGVLKRGQVGILEGDGAEAVVPLEKNKQWIRAVANDMMVQLQTGTAGASTSNITNNKDYNFTQIINAPKAPSRLELYKQTRNLLSYARRVG